jgi:hypothetical protein
MIGGIRTKAVWLLLFECDIYFVVVTTALDQYHFFHFLKEYYLIPNISL